MSYMKLFPVCISHTKNAMHLETILFKPRFIADRDIKFVANGSRCPRLHLILQPKQFRRKTKLSLSCKSSNLQENPPECCICQTYGTSERGRRGKLCYEYHMLVLPTTTRTVKPTFNFQQTCLAIEQNSSNFIIKLKKKQMKVYSNLTQNLL